MLLNRPSPEQIALRDAVRRFAANEIMPVAIALDREHDAEKRLPWDLLAKAEKLGLRTLALSEANGGGGADALTDCIVAEELACADAGIATTLSHTSDLSRLFFDHLMSEEQRERYLPPFLSDERFHLAFAGHEPDTDLGWVYHRPDAENAGYRTRAVRDGAHWVINGAKNFITNAQIAKLILVNVQIKSESGDASRRAMIFLERETPGLTILNHDKVGHRLGSTGEIFFDNCRVPAANIVAGPMRETGTAATNRIARPRIQALNLGVGRAAYEEAVSFARLRVHGGRPIIEHQAVAIRIADMAIALEQARALIWQAASRCDIAPGFKDYGEEELPLQAIARVATSEAVLRVVTDATQILGGMGVMREAGTQKFVRDALVFLPFEHTNDVVRLRIAERIAGFRRGLRL